MIPASLAPYLPWLTVASAMAVVAAYLLFAIRRRGLAQRPLLLGATLLGFLPALYVGLVWVRLLPDRHLRMDRPLLALPVAIAVAFVAWRLTSLSPRQSRVRRGLTEAFMTAAALLAALAAVGPELGKPLDTLAVIVAIDRSRSIDLVADAEARLKAELQVAETGMRDRDRIGTIAFAAEAAIEDPLRPRSRLPAPQKVELGRDGTDIASAIRRALAEVPPDSAARIVVVSDGVATRGDAIEAAAAAVAADVPVDVVPLDQRAVPDVRVVGVRMPSRANEGEALDLRIVTSSSALAEIEVRVYRDDELIRRGRAKVAEGEDVLVLREEAPGPGLHRYDVKVTALDPKLDQAPEDNEGSAFVRIRGPASVLVMEGDPPVAAALVRSLQSAAFQTHTVGPSGVPSDVAGLAAYDVIFLSDIPAHDLSPTQLQALATYVRDLGGGLVLMGGDRSMGPGGYGKTPVEEVSPVSFDLKQERRRASLAEIIAIDYSGSMGMSVGGKTKLQLANEASVRSAELLGSGDKLGVMHVDTAVKWTLPLTSVTDQKAIAHAIRAVGPGGGGIYVDLTLREAYAALFAEKANLKHLLLFADGSDAEERSGANTLVSDALRRGVTTSVVSLGRGHDVPALEHMSKLGGGRFYLIEDATRLPAVFAQETILASRSAINEVRFRPFVGSRGSAIRGVDFGASPELTGYVVSIAKGRAQVHLRGPEDDPILATWSVGIGRAGAFTSDYKDRWGSAWTQWEGATRLFGQLARDVARRADDPRVRLEADASGGELHVRATVVGDDGRAESFRRLRARVAGPDGFRREVTLEGVGAGAYAATVPLSRPGAYVATAIDELSGEPTGTTGAVLSAGEELRPTGTDRALLGRIASMTRGKQRDTLAGIFEDRVAERFAYRELTPWLLLLSGALLLMGVGARRFAPPAFFAKVRECLRERRDARARRAAGRTAGDGSATMGALLGAKERGAVPPRTTDEDGAPASVPSFARPPPVASAPPGTFAGDPARTSRAGPRPDASVSARVQPGVEAPPPSARALSSVEILLARRRGQRR